MSFLWWPQGPRKPFPQGRQRRCRPAVEPLEERAVPAGGDLDLSFSFDGKQTVGFDLGGFKSDELVAVAIDGQGRIVLAGSADVGNFTSDFAVARLNPDGSLDTTFSGDGKQTVAFNLGGGNQDRAHAVALDAQGRIVLAGSAEQDCGFDFAVARLNPDGSLDTTFSGDGKRTVPFDLGGPSSDVAAAVALDAQGRIVLAGSAEPDNGNSDFAVARLNPDGSLDLTFSGGIGRQTVAFDLGGSRSDVAGALALDARGRIVLAAYAELDNSSFDFAAARLNPDGSLDPTFSGTGKQTVAFDLGGSWSDKAGALALDAQGRIVLAGKADVGNGNHDF